MTPNDIDEQRAAHGTIDAVALVTGSITVGPGVVTTGVIAPQPEAEDLFQAAHEAAAKHLEACWDAFHAEQEGDDDVVSPASAPFDGCQTCETRETLHAAWPLLRLAALTGYGA